MATAAQIALEAAKQAANAARASARAATASLAVVQTVVPPAPPQAAPAAPAAPVAATGPVPANGGGTQRPLWHWFVIIGAVLLVLALVLGTFFAIRGFSVATSAIPAIAATETAAALPSATPSPTLEVGQAVEATLRPEEIHQRVEATRLSWVTPSPTPCGWQGLCPLATATATSEPLPTAATSPSPIPSPTVTSSASPNPVACTGILEIENTGGITTVAFENGVSRAYSAGFWPAGSRIRVEADREVDFALSWGVSDYMYLPRGREYEFRFFWPAGSGQEEVVGEIVHQLAGRKYTLWASYAEGQETCLASVSFQVDP